MQGVSGHPYSYRAGARAGVRYKDVRGGWPCPIEGCDYTDVIPGFVAQHVRKEHPESTTPPAKAGGEGGAAGTSMAAGPQK